MEVSNTTGGYHFVRHDAVSELLDAIKHSVYWRACLTVFAILLATRIRSTIKYKQAVSSGASSKTPPTLPYWIPFLRHAFSMGWNAKRFAAQCLNKYGDGTPFFINAAGKKILFLLDPSHVKRVLAASKELDPNPFIHDMIVGQMLATPPETIEFYKNDDGKMDHVQMAHIRQHVTGSGLVSMSNKIYERLKHNIGKVVSVDNEWKPIPDLFAFVQDQVTVAITETLMGTNITEQYSNMTTDQWTFIDYANEIVMGLPRSIIPAAYNARDRLLTNLKTWDSKSEGLRTQGKANPSWDPVAGSGLMQERQELYNKTPEFSADARVSQVLGLLFAGNGLTPPVTFWLLFETLKDPNLFQKVTAELDNHFDPTMQKYNSMDLAAHPLLQSLYAETTRYYASNITVRVVTTPTFDLDDKYTITKGTTVFIYNKFTALHAPGWSSTRPSLTSRALDTFWAERFLVQAAGQEKREVFNDSNLTGSYTSFGGGEHKCPGRHFARNIGIATLAILLGEFEVELVEGKDGSGKGWENIVPNVRDSGFGKMEPKRKVAGRIRRKRN